MKQLSTNKFTKGVNENKFIVLHHTASNTGSFDYICKLLSSDVAEVSCHYVVDTDGSTCKIGNDDMILWHAGKSSYKGYNDLNKYSIGIEVIGPLTGNRKFTEEQFYSVRKIIVDLMKKYNIPKENIIRHKDISLSGKIDIDDAFWSEAGYDSFIDYQNSFMTTDTRFTQVMKDELSKANTSPVFSSHEGENTLTEKEIRELIEIAICRAKLNS